MSYILDVVGAIVISGFVLLALLAVMMSVRDSETNTTMDNMVQTTTTNVASLIENDFRKIGFNMSLNAQKILAADTSSITFCGDIDSTGSIDTVRYYLGSLASSTPNPSDKALYRVVNGVTLKGTVFGCTTFNLSYYDSLGNVTATLTSIRSIGVKMNLQSVAANNQRYAGTYWQARFRPMNLSGKY